MPGNLGTNNPLNYSYTMCRTQLLIVCSYGTYRIFHHTKASLMCIFINTKPSLIHPIAYQNYHVHLQPGR